MSQKQPNEFIGWLRAAGPYIKMFRGQVFVIAFDSQAIESYKFANLASDINLLTNLGIRIVLVHGAKVQIERELKNRNVLSKFKSDIRITDEECLSCVEQINGALRLKIEAGLSANQGSRNAPESRVRVASGNFVSAKPLGVIKGTDMLFSGDVRKIDIDGIQSRLKSDELVLLSPIGYSSTGKVFNLNFENVAAKTAVDIRADKLIFLTGENGIKNPCGLLQRELTISETKMILKKSDISPQARQLLHFSSLACLGGVSRIHIIDREVDGSLLIELLTHEGSGTLISNDPPEKLRKASKSDITGIRFLLSPHEKTGVLVKRTKKQLAEEIGYFLVLEHDDLIVGCAELQPYDKEKVGELSCLVIHPNYQNSGGGKRLLQEIESQANSKNLTSIFALTTNAEHWFIENGFSQTNVDYLPLRRQTEYNQSRKSKIFKKSLYKA